MKIAFIIGTLGMGGAEKQLVYSANALAKRGNVVHIYTLKNEARLENQLAENVVLIKGNFRSILSLSAFIRLSNELSLFSSDIIHCHLYNANIIGRLLSLRLKDSVIINHIHGLGSKYSKLRLFVDRWSSRGCDHFLFVSEKSRSIRIAREKYPVDKTMVIHNSVDLKNFESRVSSQSKKTIIFGVAARLIKLKRIQDCINLIDQLRYEEVEYKLYIAGVGPELEFLNQEVINLQLSDKICFLGFISDIKGFYDSINVLLLSSETEDLPLSIIEALALGKPVIATDVGGVSEILKGASSLLTTSFTSNDFVDQVKFYLDNLNYEECFIQNTEIARLRFDIESNTDKLQNLYSRLIKSKTVV